VLGVALVVQAKDLAQVCLLGGRRLGMYGGDGGFESECARRFSAQYLQHQISTLVNLRSIPPNAILVREHYQIAAGIEPGRSACVVQQHQRPRGVHLRDRHRQ
jgi:hypothetical protein